jgi:hypothetical protein
MDGVKAAEMKIIKIESIELGEKMSKETCPECGAKAMRPEGCGCITFECGTVQNCIAMQDVCYKGKYTISQHCVELRLKKSEKIIDELVKGITDIRDNHALPYKHRQGTTTPTCERLLKVAKGD